MSERSFAKRDLVDIKLQPYRQKTLAHRQSQKLASKYYGPYEVLARNGIVAYKLKLPLSATIHLVFHVSLLKKKWEIERCTPYCQLYPLLLFSSRKLY
jgi:hypothetical protein